MKKTRMLALTVALSLSLNVANADNQAFFVPEHVNGASAYTPVAVGEALYTRYEGRWYRYTLESDGMTDIGAGAQALSPATGEYVSNLSVWNMTTGELCCTLEEGASFVSPYDGAHVLYASAPKGGMYDEDANSGMDIRLLDMTTSTSVTK